MDASITEALTRVAMARVRSAQARTKCTIKRVDALLNDRKLYPRKHEPFVAERKRNLIAGVQVWLTVEYGLGGFPLSRWFEDADAADLNLAARPGGFPFEHFYSGKNTIGLWGSAEGDPPTEKRIWLHSKLDGAELAAVYCHEVFHFLSPAGTEAEADAFGDWIAGRLDWKNFTTI